MQSIIDYLVSIHFATWFATTAGIVAFLGGAYKFGRVALGGMRRVSHFLDQWMGDPRPGSGAAVPGVLGRLSAIEVRQTDAAKAAAEVAVNLAAVDHELHPNSGGSMFDKLTKGQAELVAAQLELVDQMAKQHDALASHLAEVTLTKGEIVQQIEEHGALLAAHLLDSSKTKES